MEQRLKLLETRYEKKLSALKIYTESYLIAGAIPALLFSFLGLATSFMSLARYQDHQDCVIAQQYLDSTYKDHIQLALRNYSCWHFAFTILYFLVLFKPFSLLYKLSGILMTCMLLAGYGVAISSIVYTNKSKCNDSPLASVSKANAVIFFILASANLLFSHTIIWIPICSRKENGHSIVPANSTVPDESSQMALNQQPVKSDANSINGQIPTPTKRPEAAEEWNKKATNDDGIE
ncbi:hypothetical protein FGO68_gene8894 [Halteria grandinella]|uniref:Uncharacterized protein n=1 Tax=Halteria grandinella TaxID=5974 RepID=A0A8J8NEN3_HALGN|nr:hypothetical protein FGO68_gene8894 [Halteria grandinella]